MKVQEIRQYVDEEGKLITARIETNAFNLEPIEGGFGTTKIVEFYGTYTIPHPQMGAMRMEFKFPDGLTIDKCFDTFKEEAEKHFNQLQEEMQKESKNKIWTPGDKDGPSGLIVPK